jgi:tRNA(Ile)-lysidine synthase TilS/MesJ
MNPADLRNYDRIIVAFSGGKDSLGCLLTLIGAGVLPDLIELHHHDVDERGAPFMDWPCTSAYCRAIANAFGLPLYLSWKEGGFEREMLRLDSPTSPICFETPDGTVQTVGGQDLRIPTKAATYSDLIAATVPI